PLLLGNPGVGVLEEAACPPQQLLLLCLPLGRVLLSHHGGHGIVHHHAEAQVECDEETRVAVGIGHLNRGDELYSHRIGKEWKWTTCSRLFGCPYSPPLV